MVPKQKPTPKPQQAQAHAQAKAAPRPPADGLPDQVVLVLQGGGALGAYQAGVYQALHEAGIEPDWVVGTSIGAINGALIAGNPPARRLQRLQTFWRGVEQRAGAAVSSLGLRSLTSAVGEWATYAAGIPSFFVPNPLVWCGPQAPVGVERAAYYSTEPLRRTLEGLLDIGYFNRCPMRVTLGAVNVASGAMRYFDTRRETLSLDHILASGALPPAFPAIRIGDDFFWDGGVYSNSPIEVVMDDAPRKNSLIFSVDLWNARGPLPESLLQVEGKGRDIQFASRADSHIERQKQLHHLRHVILEMALAMPDTVLDSPHLQELAAWGCNTTMQVARIYADNATSEDPFKDMDFSAQNLQTRWQAGYANAQTMIARAPWTQPVDDMEGIVVYDNAGFTAPVP